jgi:LuxR family maltose regulon positive regulatory protein
MPVVESLRARLWTAQGNVEAASLWVEASGLRADDALSYAREGEFIILARVLISQKRWNAAADLISQLLEATERGERWGRVIELLILRALLLEAQDKPGEALDAFARALTLAEPEGYQRLFVDEGQPAARLLYRAAAAGILPGYAGQLLAALHDSESTLVAGSKVREPKSAIVEPLSKRELEVLFCLAEGLSNREVAQRLTISLTTVKTHTRNIYRKLDVNSRMQAVVMGKALGIVGS